MSAFLISSIRRLEREQQDDKISSIDLRGRGSSTGHSAEEECVPRREKVLHLTRVIQSNYSCRLKELSLHNIFLKHDEMPALFGILGDLHLLEKLVIFHHDLGDDMVGLLVDSLAGSRGSTGLKELYLSHCNIKCKGASRIAGALTLSSSSSDDDTLRNNCNKLEYLQILSLGSNQIKKEGAKFLAKAFGQSRHLHRLVLHGNDGLLSDDMKDMVRYALTSEGWQQAAVGSKAHATPMDILSPLVISHVSYRWEKDRVLVRPYELARNSLLEEVYSKESSYIDDRFKKMPDILSWMGRVGICSKPPSSDRNYSRRASLPHSSDCNKCAACKNIHLNDIYVLMRKKPHLALWFRSTQVIPTEELCSAIVYRLSQNQAA